MPPTTVTPFQWMTLGIAVIAMLIAAGSLRVAFLAYRAGGPRIFVSVKERLEIKSRTDWEITGLEVNVSNRGRGTVEVTKIALVTADDSGRSEERLYVDKHDARTNNGISFDIGPGTERQFYIDHRKLPIQIERNEIIVDQSRVAFTQPRMEARVYLANGDVRTGRLESRYTARVIREQARFPAEGEAIWAIKESAELFEGDWADPA
jgi:hypothetical protein